MATNKSPVGSKGVAIADEFADWSEEQIGFAPYWNPSEGDAITLTVLNRDERSVDFIRYTCRAEMHPIDCFRGKSSDARPVTVNPGDIFTMSIYSSLEEPFDFYLASGLQPKLRLTVLDKTATNTPGRTVWQWKLQVDPVTRPKLEALRANITAKEMSGGTNGKRPALAE